MTSYGDHTGPLAIAHRGGMGLAPENTLAAFGRATSLGLTHLETDVRTTRDGELVCFHDATLRRTTGERGSVADLDLVDVRRLRVDGREPVPTLAKVVAERSADLLVVGNRGLNTLAGRILGSVPSEAARRAGVDVLIVHTT